MHGLVDQLDKFLDEIQVNKVIIEERDSKTIDHVSTSNRIF
jgi:hypothetical protein